MDPERLKNALSVAFCFGMLTGVVGCFFLHSWKPWTWVPLFWAWREKIRREYTPPKHTVTTYRLKENRARVERLLDEERAKEAAQRRSY